ncbi:MAG TPA: alpha/beta fold hydrolase [Stellaceae bacterium]|jgi:pimeloyl-ACP methyl ester carboxylesterase|nr:alpha/beta fold hydrolase [Stellaceae bacterium]
MTLPLVLLPGLLCDERLWQYQRTALSALVPPGPTGITVGDLTAADNVSDLAASVLAKAPERFALAGFSMGGYTAFEIMRQAPERVMKLALIDTMARPDAADQVRLRQGLISLARGGTFKGITPRLLPQLLHPDLVASDPLAAPVGPLLMEMAEKIGREGFIRQQHAILSRPDSRPLLPGIKVPTLVMTGDADQRTPPEAGREMAAAVPGARFVLIEGAGHVAPLEQPAAVSAAMAEWLAG